ncbi:MAG: hypothetical protein U0269_13650 [Polyangiales bacterium]
MNALIEAPATIADFDRARAYWIEQIGEAAYEAVRQRATSAANDDARRAVRRLIARATRLMDASEPSRSYAEFARQFERAVRVPWGLARVVTLGRKVSAETLQKEQTEATSLAAELYKQQASEKNKAVRAKAIENKHYLVYVAGKLPGCASCKAADEFEALASADIWHVLTPPIHNPPRCRCKVKPQEKSTLATIGKPPLTDEQKAKLANYAKKQVMALQVAMKRAANTEVEVVVNGKTVKKPVGWIQSPDGTMLPTRYGPMGMGPCLSIAVNMNETPPKMAFRVNQNSVPNSMPECLRKRIEAVKSHQVSYHKAFNTSENAKIVGGCEPDFGYPGHHSEVHAAAAVMGKDCDSLEGIAIFNVRLDGNPLEYGVDMPCCRHCGYILGDGGEPGEPKQWEETPGAWKAKAKEAAENNKPKPRKPVRGTPEPVDKHKGVAKLADKKPDGSDWAASFATKDEDGKPLHDSVSKPNWEKDEKALAKKAELRKRRASAKKKSAESPEPAAEEAAAVDDASS